MTDQTRQQPPHPRPPRAARSRRKSWTTEAAVRMLMNNLDDEVAEDPQSLVVYGGIGRAARNWAMLSTRSSRRWSGSRTTRPCSSSRASRSACSAPTRTRRACCIANSNLVPKWANWEVFNELDRKGLMMYGQMTAGSWIYIGTQGIVQGTYETFAEMGRQHYGGDLKGKWILTAGLGGMGGAQPLAAVMAGAHCIAIEVPGKPDREAARDALPRPARDQHRRGARDHPHRDRADQRRPARQCRRDPARDARSAASGPTR